MALPSATNRLHQWLQECLASGRSPFPLLDRLGGRFVDLSEGRAVIECDVDASHHNPVGVVHGGIAFFLMDTAIGFASMTRLAPGMRTSTVQMNINYIRAVTKGRLRAEAKVLRQGRTIAHVEARTWAENGDLVAQCVSVAAITPDAA